MAMASLSPGVRGQPIEVGTGTEPATSNVARTPRMDMTLAKHRFCLQIAALMGCLGLQPSRAADLPTSKHFTLVEMADGVWAAIAKPGGWSICNIGIIDLGKDVVLFDAGMNRHAAAELSATAEKLTGRPVTTVVLSHGHSDHVRGAIGLPTGLTIIATPQIVTDTSSRPSTEVETMWHEGRTSSSRAPP